MSKEQQTILYILIVTFAFLQVMGFNIGNILNMLNY